MSRSAAMFLLMACWAAFSTLASANRCSLGDKRCKGLLDLTATEAAQQLCNKKVTAVEYAGALLDHIDQISCINALAKVDEAKVMQEAAEVDAKAQHGEDVGPLCGLTFAVKDNIDVVGYETVAGTPALEGLLPTNSSPLVTRLRNAHGVVIGKTRMHELAEGVTTINPLYGPTLNPYDNVRHVGGSSGGTGALIAARGITAGFCSDTGGSCRIPASLTGTVGFRPTVGCYNAADGIVPMSTTRDTVGVMARSVADVIMYDAIFTECTSPEPAKPISPKGLRVGYPTNWWTDLGNETQGAFDAALVALEAAGVVLVKFDEGLLIQEGLKNAPDPFTYKFEMPRELSRYLYQHRYTLSLPELIDKIASPLVKQSLADWSFRPLDTWPTPADYLFMLGTETARITSLWRRYFEIFEFDTMLTPTTPITARPIDAAEPFTEMNGKLVSNNEVLGRTASIDCPSGIPGLSIPIGLASDGLPIGIQLQSRPGDDALLLATGLALEPLFAKTPPPPHSPPCSGCTPKVGVQKVTYKEELPGRLAEAGETSSVYTLEFEGACDLLSSAGRPDDRSEL